MLSIVLLICVSVFLVFRYGRPFDLVQQVLSPGNNQLANKIINLLDNGTWVINSEWLECEEKNIRINMDFPFVTCKGIGLGEELGSVNVRHIRQKAKNIYDTIITQRNKESQQLQAEQVRQVIRSLDD